MWHISWRTMLTAHGSVVRAMRWKPAGCGFESGSLVFVGLVSLGKWRLGHMYQVLPAPRINNSTQLNSNQTQQSSELNNTTFSQQL